MPQFICSRSLCLGFLAMVAGVLSFVVVAPESARADTVVLSADTQLRSGSPGANFGDAATVQVSNTGPIRTLLRFDLSTLPPAAVVTQAKLRLFVASVTTAGTFRVQRVTTAWNESTVTAGTAPAVDAAVLTTGSVVAADVDRWVDVDLTAQVQSWLSGLQPNHGIQLGANAGAVRFTASSKEGNASNTELEVVLQGPAGAQGAQGLPGASVVAMSIGPGFDCATGGTRFSVGGTDTFACNGEAGAQGPPGVPGADGAMGAQGPQGPPGVPGADGATGAQGAQGLQGPQGSPGADGAAGMDGAPGESVVAMSIGPGFDCSAGGTRFSVGGVDSYACNGEAGAQGPQGPQGLSGTDGAMGAQGPQGPPGADGATGVDGAPGESVVAMSIGAGFDCPAGGTRFSVGGVDTYACNGEAGAQGPQGPQGVPGADGAMGAQGPQGPQGATGAMGPQGPPGAPSAGGVVRATFLTTGSEHGCVLLSNGSARCWGYNNRGQLGNGSLLDNPVPTAVAGLGAIRSIAAGAQHTCAVLDDGSGRCWGWNLRGGLGNGTTADSPLPVEVVGLTAISAIAAGGGHSCALLDDGSAWCWGDNGYGQLGTGTHGDSLVPRVVIDSAGPLSGIASLALGTRHSCALLRNGTVDCWGENHRGQLGNGSRSDSGVAVPVPGLTGVVSLSLGGEHTCATRVDGSVSCWGFNGRRQTGVMFTSDLDFEILEPRPVIGLDMPVVATAAGGHHSCALVSNRTVRCWGGNAYGEAGNGRTMQIETSPQGVAALGEVAMIAAAGQGAFSCALLVDGSVRCWGYNQMGELGSATTMHSSVPVPLLGLR